MGLMNMQQQVRRARPSTRSASLDSALVRADRLEQPATARPTQTMPDERGSLPLIMSPLVYGLGCAMRDSLKAASCRKMCDVPCEVMPNSCSTVIRTPRGLLGFCCNFYCERAKAEYGGGPIIVHE